MSSVCIIILQCRWADFCACHRISAVSLDSIPCWCTIELSRLSPLSLFSVFELDNDSLKKVWKSWNRRNVFQSLVTNFLDNINFQSPRILETNCLSSIQVKMPCVPAVMLLCSVEFTVFCQYLWSFLYILSGVSCQGSCAFVKGC